MKDKGKEERWNIVIFSPFFPSFPPLCYLFSYQEKWWASLHLFPFQKCSQSFTLRVLMGQWTSFLSFILSKVRRGRGIYSHTLVHRDFGIYEIGRVWVRTFGAKIENFCMVWNYLMNICECRKLLCALELNDDPFLICLDKFGNATKNHLHVLCTCFSLSVNINSMQQLSWA